MKPDHSGKDKECKMINWMKKDRLTRFEIIFIYSILFLLVCAIVFMPFLLFKRTLIWNSDGYLQWYAILAKIKNVVSDFFQGKGFSFWSWDTGLGADLIGDYAFVLCDPFSYLAVLFEDKYLDVAYSVIVVLKMYLGGLVILGFTRYHKKKDWLCILCAVGYAFCAWSVGCLRHDFFMSQIILFPLLIWGVDRVYDKKSPVVLILSVMASVITSLYFSYMSAIFVFIYIVMKYFLCEENKNVRSFCLRMLSFILYAITGGVLLAGPVLFPVLSSLFQASKGSGMDLQFLPNLKQILRFIPALAGTGDVNGNYSILGTNILFVSFIPTMLLLWRKKKVSFYMFFLSALFVLLPSIQSVLNGMSYASGRWCYVFSFFLVYAVSDCIDTQAVCSDKYRKGIRIWFSTIFISALLAGIVFKAISLYEFLIVLINLVFGIYIVSSTLKEKDNLDSNSVWSNRRLFFVTLANIVILPFIAMFSGFGNGISTYLQQGVCYDIYDSTALKTAAEFTDTDFYRVDTVDHPGNNGIKIKEAHTPANTNIFWQVPSIFEYLSTVNEKWIEFNQLLGNSAGNFRRVCVYSNDNRSRIDFLLGVKYFLADDRWDQQSQYAGYGFRNVKKKESGIKVLKSPYKTGLGFVFDKTIAKSDFMKFSELEREQVLMQCVELEDDDMDKTKVSKADSAALNINNNSEAAIVCDEDGISIKSGILTISQKGQKIKLKTKKVIKDSEVYVVFKNFRKKLSSAEDIWQLQNEKRESRQTDEPDAIPLPGEDALKRFSFFSNYLSYTPYSNFSIIMTNQDNNIRKRVFNAEGEAQGIRDNKHYIVNMGYYKNYNGEIVCEFDIPGEYSFDSIDIVSVPINSYKEQAEVLSKNRFKVKRNLGDYVKGKVNTEKGGMLFLSILYNPNWKVYIDGKQAEKVYRVNNAFLGVEISAGDHLVELCYRPMGYPYSLWLFLVGFIITIAIALYFKRKSIRTKEWKQEEKTA